MKHPSEPLFALPGEFDQSRFWVPDSHWDKNIQTHVLGKTVRMTLPDNQVTAQKPGEYTRKVVGIVVTHHQGGYCVQTTDRGCYPIVPGTVLESLAGKPEDYAW